MSFFLLKSTLALFLLASAFGAALTMLTIMGKAEKKANPQTLRKIHKFSGRLFLLLLIPLIFLGMRHWSDIDDQASGRAVFHAVLAWGLITVFLIKVAVVKMYKQFLRFAPTLGLLLLGFVIVVFAISAGYYSVKAWNAGSPAQQEIDTVSSEIAGNVERGASFFNAECLPCHYADSDEKKIGPGLKDLFKREKLPYSSRPTSVENIKQQLLRPAMVMPSFTKMTKQELADLIAYLNTL